MDIDGYDPYVHRTQADTETWMALMHYVKGNVGTGILAMPLAFVDGGIIAGTALFLLATIMVTYGLQLLIRCKYKLCKRKLVPFLTYGEAVEYALEIGPPDLTKYSYLGHVCIEAMVFFNQLGSCISYCMFVPSNIKSLVDSYTDPSTHLHLRAYIGMITLPFLLIVYVRNYRQLSPFSVATNICTLLGITIVFVYIFKDGLGDISDRHLFGEPINMPPFFGTCLFSLVSIGVVLSMEQHMKYPRDWIKPCGVQNIGMAINFILFVSVGLFGYLKYGDDCKPSVTLNLDQDEAAAKITRVLYAMAIYVSYGLLMFYPHSQVYEVYCVDRMKNNTNHPIRWEYAVRTGMCLFTIIVAACVPYLNHLISLIGSFRAVLVFSFPALMNICLSHPDYGRGNWLLVKDLFLIVFGIFILCLGMGMSISNIIKEIQKEIQGIKKS